MLADPLRFMAGLETLASTDYSLCIKAGVHFTLCGGTPFHITVGRCCSVSPCCVQGHCQNIVLTRISAASSLYGRAGTIAKLGTKKHHAEFLPRLDTLDLPGCFG